MKGGASSQGENGTFVYRFHGNPRETFKMFFGTDDPFSGIFNFGHSSNFDDPMESDCFSSSSPFSVSHV